MVLAQGLGEYGALSRGGGVSSGLAHTLSTIERAVRDTEPRTWIVVAFGVFFVWFLFLRTR